MQRGTVGHKANILLTLLWNASLNGDFAMLQRLLEKHDEERGGVDGSELSIRIFSGNNEGRNALFAACLKNRHECASLLIEKGFLVDQVDNEGSSALYVACTLGHSECASLLLSQVLTLIHSYVE